MHWQEYQTLIKLMHLSLFVCFAVTLHTPSLLSGLCLEKVPAASPSLSNKNTGSPASNRSVTEREQEIITCYEKSGDIALLYLQEAEKVCVRVCLMVWNGHTCLIFLTVTRVLFRHPVNAWTLKCYAVTVVEWSHREHSLVWKKTVNCKSHEDTSQFIQASILYLK